MGEENSQKSELQSAAEGVGPLLQRDYWAVLQTCPLSPHEVMSQVREQFADFPPKELVVFRRVDGASGPLEVGDELEVIIRMMKPVKVRVLDVCANSITLGTAKKHPEAGRITFGCYRNEHKDIIFHIRSRARTGSLVDYAGFLAMGNPMQINTWTGYINNLSHMFGEGVIGAIQVEEQEVEQEEGDKTMNSPTFTAQGD